jgi:hypothetical protein
MYARQTGRFPIWLVVAVLALLILAFVYIWQGFAAFLETDGHITGIETRNAAATAEMLAWATESIATASRLNLIFNTATPLPPCQDFTVTVIRARVRVCPGETCDTIERPYENARICVYRVVPEAPEWYEVNLEPDQPLPRIGYMHQSVIYPVNPTRRPTRTPPPTETPTPSRTYTPLPTVTPVPTSTPGPPTATPMPGDTPTPPPPSQTPVPPFDSA